MSTQTFKCPSCGAGIEFNPELGLFKCDYCLSEYTTEAITEYHAKETARLEAKHEVLEQKAAAEVGQEEPTTVRGYHCDSCGASVETDDTTTATFCYYCHNPVVIVDRLAGDMRPHQLVPFRISREQAIEQFLGWAKKRRYIDQGFVSAASLEKMTGIYLPFWYSDANIDYKMMAHGVRIRTWSTRNRTYTERSIYQIDRNAHIFLDDLSLVAYSKSDQDLIYGILPYQKEDLVPFSQPYLSGFFAEQYDRAKEDCYYEMEKLAVDTARNIVRSSIHGYSSVDIKHEEHDLKFDEWLYTLLPVWMLTYQFNNKTYVYALNGVTGRAYGELPLNRGKLMLHTAILILIILIILLLGGYFIL
ncbi:MAG: hypothetical protein ACOYCB_02015 [Fastidiosipilaceae bacterium]|jgi:DNA-directed RNA polymerase subunit RPC12/RpoP|nr:hypothetical protein [Clostridiaceae bacterium]